MNIFGGHNIIDLKLLALDLNLEMSPYLTSSILASFGFDTIPNMGSCKKEYWRRVFINIITITEIAPAKD